MKNAVKIAVISAAVAASACRKTPEQNNYDDESKKTSVVSGGGSGASQQLLTMPIDISYSSFGLLGTPADAYSVTLDSCLSGYTATVDETNLDGVEVYKDDRNCLAKLTELTVAGTAYNVTNPGATDFTTWLANDTALFASGGGATLRVKVVSQLASPIGGTEAVVYNFSELLDGDGDYAFSEAEVSDPHLITVESQEAPLFNLVAASYAGMDDVSGAAEMTFKLECVDDPTAATPTSVAMTAGSAADTLCSANDLNAVTYKLVKDTFGGVLTITDAETIMSAGTTSITIPTDQYADSPTNEGFNTVVLDGPGPLGTAGNENMLLVLMAGVSFTYFNVDITTISQ